ncbi:imidazole glycerol phosphate synthase subunit HisH [Candidatus Pelagibacter communis]|jgi:imidazole glycerol-phosphate synthase subunit HisH|uniref:imidazole glycerol phosphate synthase subunit HisH n=1 Tax=Pelagibacter ubique TaxID=198252 RepID=UPI00035F374F|nr:imidazole glycerol phosphate synthase subunit HisH [Candidatus Pelagibacter ubique]
MKQVTILDYGMGNIKSIFNAIKTIGMFPKLYSENNNINSNICIIPGVGAFNHAIKLINEKQISEKIKIFSKSSENLLIGICLGMQILFEKSDENMDTNGLNLIQGEVLKISMDKNDKLPNVGWKKTLINKNIFFPELEQFNKEEFYYIHSYACKPKNKEDIIALSSFKDQQFCSIVANKPNIIGMQFHPEKSSKVGLELLENIIKKF